MKLSVEKREADTVTAFQAMFVTAGYSSPRAVERDDYATIFEAEREGGRVRLVCLDASVMKSARPR
ncbi:MAG TPA: hypothetical protein VM686_24365, partial [Polyangiaceae bacterium]|nr:hypothetical protein [Polyangiaceae bacterium]